MKICRRCKTEQPTNNFRAHKQTSDNLQTYCKGCQSEYAAEYNDQNREKRKALRREYYLKNKEHIIGKTLEWQKNNRDKVLESSKKYQTNNKEKVSEWQKSYGANNPLKIKMKHAKKCMPPESPAELIEAKALQLLIKHTIRKQDEQHN